MSRRVFFRQLLCMGGHCGPYTTREVATFRRVLASYLCPSVVTLVDPIVAL